MICLLPCLCAVVTIAFPVFLLGNLHALASTNPREIFVFLCGLFLRGQRAFVAQLE